ncbi:hypothetical protein ACTMU2_35255 [Cupriavidus basilensis]
MDAYCLRACSYREAIDRVRAAAESASAGSGKPLPLTVAAARTPAKLMRVQKTSTRSRACTPTDPAFLDKLRAQFEGASQVQGLPAQLSGWRRRSPREARRQRSTPPSASSARRSMTRCSVSAGEDEGIAWRYMFADARQD